MQGPGRKSRHRQAAFERFRTEQLGVCCLHQAEKYVKRIVEQIVQPSYMQDFLQQGKDKQAIEDVAKMLKQFTENMSLLQPIAIKCFKETDSSKVRLTIDEEIYHAETLRRELKALGGNPVLVGLGVKSYAFLKRHFGKTHKVVKVMHYSYYIGLGKYRNAVLGALKKF